MLPVRSSSPASTTTAFVSIHPTTSTLRSQPATNSPPAIEHAFSHGIRDILSKLETSKEWDTALGELVPRLLVCLPGWPQERAIMIRNQSGTYTYKAVPSNSKEQLPAIKLLLQKGRYSSLTNDNPPPIAPSRHDPDFYSAILNNLTNEEKVSLLGSTSTPNAYHLRACLAHYVRAHPQEVEHLLATLYAPSTNTTPSFSAASLALSQHSPFIPLAASLQTPFPAPRTGQHSHFSPLPLPLLAPLLATPSLTTQPINPQKTAIAPSIYAIPMKTPNEVPTKLFNDYKKFYRGLAQNEQEDLPTLTRKRNAFLKPYGIEWSKLNKYVKNNSHLTLRGAQLLDHEEKSCFNPITIGLLEKWRNPNNRSIQKRDRLDFFASRYNIYLHDWEKFAAPSQLLTLRGKQAVDVHRGKIFSPITQHTVENYLKAFLVRERYTESMRKHLERFCERENILFEEFERFLVLNNHLVECPEALSRHLACANYSNSSKTLPSAFFTLPLPPVHFPGGLMPPPSALFTQVPNLEYNPLHMYAPHLTHAVPTNMAPRTLPPPLTHPITVPQAGVSPLTSYGAPLHHASSEPDIVTRSPSALNSLHPLIYEPLTDDEAETTTISTTHQTS